MDQKDREPVRTTIVGGQPTVRTKASRPIPEGLEEVIARAALDPQFKERLFAGRVEAVEASGMELNASEAMLLRSVSDAQLEELISQAVPDVPPRREFLAKAGGWAAALLAVSALPGCKRKKKKPPPPATEGARPDVPEPVDDDDDDDDDGPPPPTRGIQPDIPEDNRPQPTRGIQPDIPPSLPETKP